MLSTDFDDAEHILDDTQKALETLRAICKLIGAMTNYTKRISKNYCKHLMIFLYNWIENRFEQK